MKKYRFTAKIEDAQRGGAYVLFPYDVGKEFGTKGRVPVKATFNGIAYSGSLMKYGAPQHMLGVLKSVREQLGVGPGDTVEVELWRDEEPRKIEVPVVLQQAMKAAGVLNFFESLSYSHQKEYCHWITDAKTEGTRQRRVAKAVEMLREKRKTPDSAGKL